MSGSSLREAAQQGDLRYLNVLLKGGSNPCSSDADGLTALHFASWNGHVDCVEALCVNDLGHATQRSKPLKGDDEETASKRMVSCINLRTRAGWSALHIAAMGAFDAARVVSLLLAMGCDSRALDAKGLLACDVAKMHDSLDAAEILDAPRPDLAARRLVLEGLMHREVVTHKFRAVRPLEDSFASEAGASVLSLATDASASMSRRNSHMGSATITTMATKLDDDDESLVYETKEDKLERARLSAVAFGGRAAVEQFVRDVDDSNTRHKVRRAPTPRELLVRWLPAMPASEESLQVSENDILPYATSLFKGRRGADVIRNLVFITEEAERAAIRREALAARQFETLATYVAPGPEPTAAASANTTAAVSPNPERREAFAVAE